MYELAQLAASSGCATVIPQRMKRAADWLQHHQIASVFENQIMLHNEALTTAVGLRKATMVPFPSDTALWTKWMLHQHLLRQGWVFVTNAGSASVCAKCCMSHQSWWYYYILMSHQSEVFEYE